jgi:hypothetical protein
MGSKELAVYDLFQGQQVRKVDGDDEKVWRVLIDCCRALGMSNVTKSMKRIPRQHLTLSKALGNDGRMRQHWLIDEEGLISLIAYSRLPKEQLDAFRELIGQRAVASDNALAQAINRMTDFMERTEARLAKLEAKGEPLLLKPVIDYSERVRLLISDWVKVHSDNPRITYASAHSRLNTRFLYRHRHNISDMGRKRNKSALQVAIDMGMGEEILSLAQELADNNFEDYFSESEEIPF